MHVSSDTHGKFKLFEVSTEYRQSLCARILQQKEHTRTRANVDILFLSASFFFKMMGEIPSLTRWRGSPLRRICVGLFDATESGTIPGICVVFFDSTRRNPHVCMGIFDATGISVYLM